MKICYSKKSLIFLAIIFLVLALALKFIYIQKQTQLALAKSQKELSKQNIIKHYKETCTPLSKYISVLANSNQVKDLVFFQGNYFAATSAGLAKYSPTGEKLDYYNNLIGLGENDLTSLTIWKDKLYIGTRSKGLLVFDGKEFYRYSWPGLKTESVSALLDDNGRLLIGTFADGLLEFDGNKFVEIKIDGQKIKAITWLEKKQYQLYIGTFDNGLWIVEPTQHQHFTTSNGLPSNRVVGALEVDKNFIVATDFGLSLASLASLASLEKEVSFQNTLILPTLSDIVRIKNDLLLVQDNGQIWKLPVKKSLHKKSLEQLINIPTTNAKIIELEKQIWLASNDGLWRLNKNKLESFLQPNPNSLSASMVSALAIDSFNQLWVGYFRNGIDIFSPTGQKVTHLENEYLREINHISAQKSNVLVSTSQGLISFDNKLNLKRLSKASGLLNHNISSSYTIPNSDTLLLATAKGLVTSKANKLSLLTKFHGLPNNNTYSMLVKEGSIYVATLTGLAQVSNGKIIRTYKDANSSLKTNWITALQLIDKQLFIGTYGGGVYELMPTGDLHSFIPETGKLVVNLNAMFSDDKRLYIGTLNGLWVYQLNNQHWEQVKLELPSTNILSITGDQRYTYIGTINGIAKIEKMFFEKLNKK